MVLQSLPLAFRYNNNLVNEVQEEVDLPPHTLTILSYVQAPFICDFQAAIYTIMIEEISCNSVVVTRKSTYTGTDRMIVEVFESELQTNMNYTLTIYPLQKISVSHLPIIRSAHNSHQP